MKIESDQCWISPRANQRRELARTQRMDRTSNDGGLGSELARERGSKACSRAGRGKREVTSVGIQISRGRKGVTDCCYKLNAENGMENNTMPRETETYQKRLSGNVILTPANQQLFTDHVIWSLTRKDFEPTTCQSHKPKNLSNLFFLAANKTNRVSVLMWYFLILSIHRV